jgi:glycosyltransferase involved in cell wall biosynthesis
VRGNLKQNYSLDYGKIGPAVAAAHLWFLRAADHVVVMTEAMANQVLRFTGGSRVSIIGNFVDEHRLERFRTVGRHDGPLRFVFLGSLTERKQPLALVHAIARLRQNGIDACAQLIGDGPMEGTLRRQIEIYGLNGEVTLRGFLPNPYDAVAECDALVLPSLSEGLSRACMEAMHLGVPCVLRAVDGNQELMQSGVSGVLFDDDEQLPSAMLGAARLSRSVQKATMRTSLLPSKFRQAAAARAYLELVES